MVKYRKNPVHHYFLGEITSWGNYMYRDLQEKNVISIIFKNAHCS